ncbi:hypothetical protein Cyast_1297 [Cyanobacterium stanieri PCC 7202]|uniref:Uncharacterized protein n=1 Tax=Cyanobacterium stanieri (strain ATCC 29140 / PCC 7202) TaxID=292563 RepID=K9YLB2_CYASC|nr:hypothetical protein Cyast_1297 [Cyanobacterium stanieri PCC 7202]
MKPWQKITKLKWNTSDLELLPENNNIPFNLFLLPVTHIELG